MKRESFIFLLVIAFAGLLLATILHKPVRLVNPCQSYFKSDYKNVVVDRKKGTVHYECRPRL